MGRRKRESPASCSISGSEEEGGFSWDRPLFKKYGLLLAKNKKMGFKMDTLLYWPSRLPVFCTGGPCARGSPRHSPAYCPFERKRETPPAYGYSSVTFFNLASTKLEDALPDADTHTGRVAWQSEVSNNRPTIYLLDCKGSQASQHSH